MFLKLVVLFSLTRFATSETVDHGFTYNSFRGSNMSLDGLAQITSDGLLMLTNNTKQQTGHAFYSYPLPFLNSSSALSFSTTFVFAIVPEYADIGAHGLAFIIAPSRGLPGALASQYLGLFNETNVGNSSNHIIAVEFDTLVNPEFGDIDGNHVGVDINDLKSVEAASASYYTDHHGRFVNLSLISGQPMQVWVEYNGADKQLNVTLAPLSVSKPAIPLLSLSRDLSPIILENMFVGFSASTGSLLTAHYLLGWSFKMNGRAQELTLSQLPKLPRTKPKKKSRVLTVGLPVIGISLGLTMMIIGIQIIVRRRRKFEEVLEDWELDHGPHRFKYKELYIATKGFSDKELLGTGGFSRVYKGVLPTSRMEVAVKRVSHESEQGMREFVAEIVSIGQLRHRNLVPLLGYCRRKGVLLLVYDFMPNGSLDKFLFDQPKTALHWNQRFQIIKGVASGLFYLHEEWEKVVIHRDVKSSNVLLDGELNGRLGDFGLAKLYDHGTDLQTTHVVGTLGYLAPEFTRTGKANPSTDVFAFGAFMLEVACGRRPIEPDLVLVDWVLLCWSRGTILETIDPNLVGYVIEEMELVLKLGLLCSHSSPTARPSMRKVVQYLEGIDSMPESSSIGPSGGDLKLMHAEGYDVAMSYPSSLDRTFAHSLSDAESLLSGGR